MPSGDCCKRTVLKLIEIGLNVVCCALVLKYNCVPSPTLTGDVWKLDFSYDYSRTYLSVAVVGAYLLICTVVLLSYAFEGIGKAPILETMLMVAGFGLSVAAGGLILQVYADQDHDREIVKAGLSFGSLQIVNGVVFLIDSIVVFKAKV